MNWKEFRPTFFFLGKFLGLYLVSNLLYGIYVSSFEPMADPITIEATRQTSWFLSRLGWVTEISILTDYPSVYIIYHTQAIVNVYEGCNGINVMLIFISFILGFGPYRRSLVWFIPLGILLIHAMNILRIGLLFWVSLEIPRYLYFTHKYLFTASIYGGVFVLWILWIRFSSRAADSTL